MILDKNLLIDRLNKATDDAARRAIEQGIPLSISKKSTIVGNLCIEKNNNKFYNILTFNKRILYENISTFDIAVIIAQRYIAGEFSSINTILSIEEKFLKNHLDMVNYIRCMKSAKHNKDFERLFILEDKLQVAEIRANELKNKLLQFKRIK